MEILTSNILPVDTYQHNSLSVTRFKGESQLGILRIAAIHPGSYPDGIYRTVFRAGLMQYGGGREEFTLSRDDEVSVSFNKKGKVVRVDAYKVLEATGEVWQVEAVPGSKGWRFCACRYDEMGVLIRESDEWFNDFKGQLKTKNNGRNFYHHHHHGDLLVLSLKTVDENSSGGNLVMQVGCWQRFINTQTVDIDKARRIFSVDKTDSGTISILKQLTEKAISESRLAEV